MNHKGDLGSGRTSSSGEQRLVACISDIKVQPWLNLGASQRAMRHSPALSATLNFLSLEFFHPTNHAYVVGVASDSSSRLIAMIHPSPQTILSTLVGTCIEKLQSFSFIV